MTLGSRWRLALGARPGGRGVRRARGAQLLPPTPISPPPVVGGVIDQVGRTGRSGRPARRRPRHAPASSPARASTGSKPWSAPIATRWR